MKIEVSNGEIIDKLTIIQIKLERIKDKSKLKNLEKHQLITLYAVAKRLKKDGTAYVNTGDAENTYNVLCEEYNEKPRAHTMFWSYLKDIQNAGFITIKLSGKGHLGTTQLISLPDIPAEIVGDKIKNLLL